VDGVRSGKRFSKSQQAVVPPDGVHHRPVTSEGVVRANSGGIHDDLRESVRRAHSDEPPLVAKKLDSPRSLNIG
jgi:hypothetical protein